MHHILLLLIILSCPLLYGQEQILSKFFHDKHMDFFTKESIDCISCHNGHITSLKEPLQNLCHQCHNNKTHDDRVPQRCLMCHTELKRIKPKDHTFAWVTSRHKDKAKVNPSSCVACHRNSFCVDCHKKRDDQRKRVHSRNFIFTHSVEMRRKPSSCNSCHTKNYCISCHEIRGVEQ